MTEHRYDAVVVGTGSGLDVANGLVEAGLRVAIVEKDAAGGTCLNRGCIPSKMLLHSADVAETIRRAGEFGLHLAGPPAVDFAAIMHRAREHVDDESRRIHEALLASENPRYFVGTGRFVGPKRLAVGNDILVAERFLLATGARPRIPPIPGLSECGFLTSDDALHRPVLPESLVILGGGFIAAELGHFFGALGTEVTIVHKHDAMLSREDRDVREAFTRAFAARHRVVLDAVATKVERAGKLKRVHVARGNGESEAIEAQDVLVAIGLTPNSDTLDLGKTNVRVDDAGRIVVDEFLETSEPGIYALGDAVGRFNLKHAANHEATYAYHNMTHPDDKIPVDYLAMPRAVFSSPQVASVGATEDELRAGGARYHVGKHAYADTAMGKALNERVGFVKLLADPEGRILGGHVVGPEASTLIHEIVLAMTMGLTAREIEGTIHVHPALSEVVQRAAASVELA